MNTIKLILDNSGQIKCAEKNFNVYQGLVGTVGIEIYVPREMLSAPMTAEDDTVLGQNTVTIYATTITETGKRVTSEAYQCVYLRKENKANVEYWVFTRVTGLPAAFLRYAGDLNICASIFKTYTDNGETKFESRSKMQMFTVAVLANPDGNLDPEYEPSELTALYDLLNTRILAQEEIYGSAGKAGTVSKTPATNLTTLEANKANKLETVLKYDLREQPLPDYLTYNKNGYKTAGVLFMNETHTVPTDVRPAINLETVTGALLVSNLYPDVEHPEQYAWQNEIFYHEKGNSARKIKLDISQFQQTGTITTVEVGDWKVQNYAWFDTTSQQIISLGNRISALEADYVSKALNILPLEEKEEFAVTNTGAFQQTTTKRDIRTGEKSTVTVTPIPVVEGQARLILPQEIQSLRQLLHWQETLSGEALNYVVDLSDLPQADVQSTTMQNYLTAKYQSVTQTPDTILDQVTIHDEVLGMAFRWYENSMAWVLSSGSLAAKATNNIYTNNTLTEQGNVGGSVGSNKEGHIFYETNGEGALNGYDALKQRGLANQQAIADEVTNRQNAVSSEAATRAAADTAIETIIGVLSNLSTTDKTTLVAAINSLKTESNTNAAAISAVADRVTTLENTTVKTTGNQSIDGEKNFVGSFKINGGAITYNAQTETFEM